MVRTASDPFDVLLVDGYDRSGQSPQLCSESFYESCFRQLSPGGIMVVNLTREDPLLSQSIERIKRRFPNTVVVNSEDGTNRIAFAPKGAGLDLSHEQLCARLGWLEHDHQVGLGRTLQRIRDAQYMRVRQPHGSVATLSDRRAIAGPSDGPGAKPGVRRVRRR